MGHHTALCLMKVVVMQFLTSLLLITIHGIEVKAINISSLTSDPTTHSSGIIQLLTNTNNAKNILHLLKRPKRSGESDIQKGLKAPSFTQLEKDVDDSITKSDARHNHRTVPLWLEDRFTKSIENKVKDIQIENNIAAIFRNAANGNKQGIRILEKPFANSGNRYERTTVLSETPAFNNVADETSPDLSGRRALKSSASDSYHSKNSTFDAKNIPTTLDSSKLNSNITSNKPRDVDSILKNHDADTSTIQKNPESINEMERESYDNELYDYEETYSNIYDSDSTEIFKRGDALLANASRLIDEPDDSNQELQKRIKPRLSWFDYLLCTNRNLSWIFVNFLLGLLLLCVSVFAPYRLLTLRSCTHILPRSHFVTVHLLVFIATSLRALYMFHLAFGGQEKLPLVLILILTNTSIPCFISAYLILIVMMFLTADVQVYKPKFLTMNNISIFIVMTIVLSFISDIIVGSAHSKSVLVLSRIMLIFIAIAVIVFYIRKYPRVINVVQMLKREFQGEMKLLVVPSKDSPPQKQMNIKFILRNRLFTWCRIMNGSTIAIGICCLIHFMHAIFLISSHVPAWIWWSAHTSGAFTEVLLGLLLCIASALTQRYDENSSFMHDLFVPALMPRKKKLVASKERNGNVVYQRVSYSSGTESTQYTTCPNDGVPSATAVAVTSRTPKAPRKRTATVRRSATFSYAPQYPRGPGRPCQPPVPNLNIMRVGSASQIPLYAVGSISPVSDIYSPASISHVPVYSPESVRSMLVHEDGFVRIRTQVDPRLAIHRRSGSHTGIYDSNHYQCGSNPQIHNNMQQWNGYGSRESFYHCLPRRRRSSRSSSFQHHNSQIAETDYFSGDCQRIPVEQINIQLQRDERGFDPTYQSIPRRRHRSRESSLKQLNNSELEVDEYNFNRCRRPSSRGLHLQHLNNLDRSEEYSSLGRRKLSREGNEPIYHNSSYDGSSHRIPTSRNNSTYSNAPSIHPINKEAISPVSQHSGSPSIKRKHSNISASPSKGLNSTSPVDNVAVAHSPNTSRREAHFPKPFSHRGSNSSLRSEDIPYLEHYQRTNPVRRNHSSAGYFPSRYLQPIDDNAIDDTQRYGSLRIGIIKKRQPGYVLHTNTSKILNKYLDKYPKTPNEEDPGIEGCSESSKTQCKDSIAEQNTQGNHDSSPSREDGSDTQSPANTSKGSDADWALDVITSSSILTDFYSLPRPKKKKAAIQEEEGEEEIPVLNE